MIGVAALVGCGGSSSQPAAKRQTNTGAYHVFPFRGKVTTPRGRPMADAAINEVLVRTSAARCGQALVSHLSSADWTFMDTNVICPGVVRVSAYKLGYVGRPVVLTLSRNRRLPSVHLVVERR